MPAAAAWTRNRAKPQILSDMSDPPFCTTGQWPDAVRRSACSSNREHPGWRERWPETLLRCV
jgi:hypothetical protein